MIAEKCSSFLLQFNRLSDPHIVSTLSSPLSGQLPPGQCLVITGTNGSGKTTLLKLLAGINHPQSGYVEASPLFYCGHQTGLKLTWSVRQNLVFRLKVYDTPVATKIEETLTKFKLGKYLHAPLGNLSRGQQQQIALISGLLSPYKLWILDEPFAHLDQKARLEWQQLMGKHCQQGGSIVYSTHIEQIILKDSLRIEL